MLEDMGCAGCGGGGGGMEGGADAYQGSAPAEGPYAGFDPLLGKEKKKQKKILKRVVENYRSYLRVDEEKKPLPVEKMTLKASALDMEADDEKEKDKKFKKIDRARKIRNSIK